MEKMKMHTPDITESNIEKIGQLFPNCLTERIGENGKVEEVIDFDLLRQELSKEIVEGPQERYQFTWPDKKKAIRLANTPSTMTLRPCREESVDFDNTENLYIEGDNLEVLKLLREDYLGKVKMIYIDPPYNTGNDFVYEDDFSQTTADYVGNSGQTDASGNRLVQNTDSNGRFHTDWLNMIYPRLRTSRDFLSSDGAIFISIDDSEVENLRKVCDEIFGASNFVAQMIWQQGRKSAGVSLAINHEYCVIYAKNIQTINSQIAAGVNYWKQKKEGLDTIYAFEKELRQRYGRDYPKMNAELKAFYKRLGENNPAYAHKHYSAIDDNGIYFPADASAPDNPDSRCHKPLIHPLTKKPCAVPRLGWRYKEATLDKLYTEGKFHFGPDETTIPCIKRYLKDTEYETAQSVFYKDGRGASGRLSALFNGKKVFDFPKDEEILLSFLKFVVMDDPDSIIMDFFSGSASTAHAVMKLNAEDGGHRSYIMVQLPEMTDPKSEAYKSGFKNICEIGKERIRRAGKLINKTLDAGGDNTGLFVSLESESKVDIGFRVLKLDSSNMEDVYYRPEESSENTLFESNVKEGRSSEDLLFQVMLECNLPLSAKIQTEKIAGKEVFTVNNGYLIACFDEDVNEEVIKAVAKRKPYYFVMRDSSLASDNVADNFEQIFQAYSKDTIRKIL